MAIVVFHQAYTGHDLQQENITILGAPDCPEPRLSRPSAGLLMRDTAITGPQQAYDPVVSKEPVEIGFPRHPGLGHTLKAVVYQQVGPRVFQAPAVSSVQFVDIDRLDRRVVQIYRGTEHDPYQPQQHEPVEVVERLQDNQYLYVVKAAATGMVG